MKRAYLIAGVGVLLVVVVGVWVTFSPGPKLVPETTQTYVEPVAEAPQAVEKLSGQDTLLRLLGLGKTLECSFQFKDDVHKSEGTGFFDGSKMRVDTMYTATSGDIFTSNMISDGQTLYVWSDTETGKFALKMPATTSRANSEADSDTSLDPNTTVWYTCQPWSVDGSVFEPPSEITFMDMTSLMEGIPSGL